VTLERNDKYINDMNDAVRNIALI